MPDSTHFNEAEITAFSDAEMASFVDLFDRLPHWKSWRRYITPDGRDAIEIRAVNGSAVTLRMTKDDHGRYLAGGFDGWGLTVAEGFEELLATLSADAAAHHAA